MDKLQMAKALLSETKYSNPGQTTTAYGVAVTDSHDGLVSVDMGGDTVSFDDEQAIECETTFKVYEGDEVIVSLIGADGSGKTPIIIGVVGRGDEQQTEIDGVKNYFWTNDRGAHISTIEQSVEGANMLLDADSLDIRIGGSNSEEDQTTVAKFGRDTAYISGIDGTRYWQIRDLRDASTGSAEVTDDFISDGLTEEYRTDFPFYSVTSVLVNGVLLTENEDYTLDIDSSTITFSSIPSPGYEVIIRYLTKSGVFSYTQGIRSSSNHGPFSFASGNRVLASGTYSEAHGYNTEASGFAAETHGSDTRVTAVNAEAHGRGTQAVEAEQVVFGRFNSNLNNEGALVIVGDGTMSYRTRRDFFSDADGLGTSFQLHNTPTQDGVIITVGVVPSIYPFDIPGHTITINTAGSGVYFLNVSPPFDYTAAVLINGNPVFLYPGQGFIELPSYPTSIIPALATRTTFVPNKDYTVIENNLTFGGEYAYWAERFKITSCDINYKFTQIFRKNIFELYSGGKAWFAGPILSGGYSVISYNTAFHLPMYWNGSVWVTPAVAQGTLEADTTGIDIELPAGSLCILFTREYNASTNVYRGHHAYLEYVPNEDLYGTTAIQQVNMAASTNSGVTITRPNTSLLNIKSYSATYNVDYRIIRVL